MIRAIKVAKDSSVSVTKKYTKNKDLGASKYIYSSDGISTIHNILTIQLGG